MKQKIALISLAFLVVVLIVTILVSTQQDIRANFYDIESVTIKTDITEGEGFLIKATGYVITSHHLIDGATSVTVQTLDSKPYNAGFVSSNKERDLAILKMKNE